MEGRPTPLVALEPHAPALALDDILGKIQAHPEAAIIVRSVGVGAEEELENTRLLLLGNPDPAIADGDAWAVAASARLHVREDVNWGELS